MKLNIIRFIPILLVLYMSSCSTNNSFEYETNKKEYQEAIKCLHQHYSVIFASKLENSISLYPIDLKQNKLCEDVLKLMKRHAIEFVDFYKDSTIAFYAETIKGIKEKQFILMFANERIKMTKKLSSDTKIIDEKDKGCYELEKIISLAN